jgi:hypothetical protein
VSTEHQGRFSPWEYLGADLEQLWSDDDVVCSSEVVAVIAAGICPAALRESINSTETIELARRFADAYQRNPELTEKMLAVIRAKWNEDTVAAKARKHLLTQAWTPVPDREGRVVTVNAVAKNIAAAIGANTATVQKNIGQRVALPKTKWKGPDGSENSAPLITAELNAALRALEAKGYKVT